MAEKVPDGIQALLVPLVEESELVDEYRFVSEDSEEFVYLIRFSNKTDQKGLNELLSRYRQQLKDRFGYHKLDVSKSINGEMAAENERYLVFNRTTI